MKTQFENRHEAGRRLASLLSTLAGPNTVVLALPRGGVPVGYQIARRLDVPLDVLIVRKLGLPGHEELAMGAIASGGARVLNEELFKRMDIPDEWVERVTADEQRELERREKLYRGDRPPTPVQDRTVILVDDGLATGSTMRAAALSLRQRGPRSIVAAVPVGAPSSCAMLSKHVDFMVCLEQPAIFMGVGRWYRDFTQTTDEEVRSLLAETQQGANHVQL